MYEQGAPGCAGRFVKHYGTDRSRYSLLRHQDFAGLPRRHVAPARSREEASVVHAGRRIDLRHLRERRDGLKKSERYCCCERHSGREPSRISLAAISARCVLSQSLDLHPSSAHLSAIRHETQVAQRRGKAPAATKFGTVGAGTGGARGAMLAPCGFERVARGHGLPPPPHRRNRTARA